MLLLAVLEGGNYTQTGRNFYKNLTELIQFGKYFHLDLKLTLLRQINDIFTLLGHIFKSAVSPQI